MRKFRWLLGGLLGTILILGLAIWYLITPRGPNADVYAADHNVPSGWTEVERVTNTECFISCSKVGILRYETDTRPTVDDLERFGNDNGWTDVTKSRSCSRTPTTVPGVEYCRISARDDKLKVTLGVAQTESDLNLFRVRLLVEQ